MLMRAILLPPGLLALAAGTASARPHHGPRHHHLRAAIVRAAPPPESFGGRLVQHPAWNIACMTRDRATRALPCDQPVWVYGKPCEIDLGQGYYRSCD